MPDDLWAWLPKPRDAPAEVRNLDTDPLTAWLDARTKPRKSPRKLAARHAAIERRLAAYVRLECGHLETRECIEAFSAWSPGRGMLHCCKCPGWVREAVPVREPVPDEPPY